MWLVDLIWNFRYGFIEVKVVFEIWDIICEFIGKDSFQGYVLGVNGIQGYEQYV